ncbi:Beta-galactosidase [Gossypium australe]|uniref:Beta-galactosidase n=1 Tax=Gossypium australe TaxID=47621 RepID=A0A5B6VA47_9ROSI|nr:Beta-galactosidase [Gossypium australe]
MIENQFQEIISILRYDNGTEYYNNVLKYFFFQEKGVLHQSSCSDTPEQNGLVERKKKTTFSFVIYNSFGLFKNYFPDSRIKSGNSNSIDPPSSLPFSPSPDKIVFPESSLNLIPIIPIQESNLSIALRKGTQTCTKYLISKNISYDNFFTKYRAFTSKISNIVAPKNIKEALDDPN